MQTTSFLKWAGGKSQLLEKFTQYFPSQLKKGKLNYFEPFIGGGSLFFFLKPKYNLAQCYLSDIAPDLILVYRIVKKSCQDLLKILQKMEDKYLPLDQDGRKEYYYEVRHQFNYNRNEDFSRINSKGIERAAQIIFLNRTCFNGLFRHNSKGEFNVPIGSYKKPVIVQETKLTNAAELLKNVTLENADFSAVEDLVTADSFVYFDPPYRPLSKTSSFTAYSKNSFDDAEQMRLARLFKKLDKKGALLMLSNSDPQNIGGSEDDFFIRHYGNYNISRLEARRNINSKSLGRGKIYELVITNY